MSAFHQHCAPKPALQFLRYPAHLLHRTNFPAHQKRCFVKIGGHQCSHRQQFLAQNSQSLLLYKARPTRRSHNRVHYQPRRHPSEKSRHLSHNLHRIQHPGLNRSRSQLLEHSLQLSSYDPRAACLCPNHSRRILCRNAGEHTGPMHPQRGERFQVSLNSRPAAAIGPCDGQRNGNSRSASHKLSLSSRGKSWKEKQQNGFSSQPQHISTLIPRLLDSEAPWSDLEAAMPCKFSPKLSDSVMPAGLIQPLHPDVLISDYAFGVMPLQGKRALS